MIRFFSLHLHTRLFLLLIFAATPPCLSQTDVPSPAPAPVAEVCNGVLLTYLYAGGTQLPPDDPAHQAYRFQSVLTVTNNGVDELKSWRAFVGFQNDELLVSASGAVLADGSSLPATVGNNGTVLAGFPSTDLQTAIQTAGDLTQMQAQVTLVGTQFGVKPPSVPMPANISLANDGFVCPEPTLQGKNLMLVCCTQDPNFKTNITVADEFLPRQSGDLTIMYDVIRTYDTNYWAQVTISNNNPLGRLDNWELSWDWMREEFIASMRGAYPSIVDSSGCLFGSQASQYTDMDFSNVLNCERRPTIIDLPPTKANDTNLGLIPNCCRNGMILPPSMDSSQSSSVFQMQVYKMPPDLNRSVLFPPQNWRINGTLNPDYQCGPPVQVSPSQFFSPNGLSSNTTAFASWQVVCNITQRSTPRCCVSFSAYYNESIVPCRTCACGCASSASSNCSATSPAILLPSQALLVPFDNRTAMTLAWAQIKHLQVPKPMPCGDNCGVSINWHVNTDYSNGWTSRITIFNWGETAFVDWFTAVELDKAAAGFQATYSFNGTLMNDVKNTIFMEGLPGLNYLIGEADGADPRADPKVPGKQQSVISFTKKNIQGINVPNGDGFPTKVFFNGEECSLPTAIPTGNSARIGSSTTLSIFLAVIIATLILQ
ncbi:COBRA-like protein 7 [Syzygium oleosum]|uniref:COBRA-like protein 7 n=1 Tax=Syzygium oleosum TaxID=219896 RepID=UPI0024B8EE81|nr:COBRA-like protein 7 [Syzygium oleosum]